MTRDIPSLRVLLFQVEDEVVLGWAKKDRLGGDWKEMDKGARRKYLASENICPASIEPCEQCERCVFNIFATVTIHKPEAVTISSE